MSRRWRKPASGLPGESSTAGLSAATSEKPASQRKAALSLTALSPGLSSPPGPRVLGQRGALSGAEAQVMPQPAGAEQQNVALLGRGALGRERRFQRRRLPRRIPRSVERLATRREVARHVEQETAPDDAVLRPPVDAQRAAVHGLFLQAVVEPELAVAHVRQRVDLAGRLVPQVVDLVVARVALRLDDLVAVGLAPLDQGRIRLVQRQREIEDGPPAYRPGRPRDPLRCEPRDGPKLVPVTEHAPSVAVARLLDHRQVLVQRRHALGHRLPLLLRSSGTASAIELQVEAYRPSDFDAVRNLRLGDPGPVRRELVLLDLRSQGFDRADFLLGPRSSPTPRASSRASRADAVALSHR